MPLKTHADEQPSLNLTPMIDIVFLLIIFFMVGTKFSELEKNMRLQVPVLAEAAAATPPPAPRRVDVNRTGQIFLRPERQWITTDELTRRLLDARRQYSELGVSIRGDRKLEYQRVAEVIKACTNAGVRKIDFAFISTSVQR